MFSWNHISRYITRNKEIGSNFSSGITKYVIISLILTNFILLGLDGINRASDPESWDTTAYLGEANFIKAHGGLLNFLNLCFTGGWKQDNQQPLYILLLTPFASTKISFFVVAKIINFLLAVILMVVFYVIVSRNFNDIVAAFAVIGLMLSPTFLEWSTLVASESALMLFGSLAIIFICDGFKNNTRWIFAGVFVSLAYLAKAIAIALLPGFLISVFLVYRFKVFSNKYFWSFLLTFFLISSPLLIRNILLYQNPFFNYNAYIVKYGVEEFERKQYVVFSMSEGSSIWKFDKTNNENNHENKLNVNQSKTNFFTHSLNVTKAFITSFNILQNYFGKKYFWVIATVLIFFLVIGIVTLSNRGAQYFTTITIFIFLVLLSFNPLPRYFLLLLPLVWAYIGLGVVLCIENIIKKFSSESKIIKAELSIKYLIILFLVLILGYRFQKLNLSNPFKTVEYSENRLEILNWLKANLDSTDQFTLGPNFYWQLNKGTWILPPNAAKYKDISKLECFVKKHDIRYIIFDREILLKYHSTDLIKKNFTIDPEKGIEEIKPIDDWQLLYKDSKKPSNYLIYKAINKNHS